MATYDITMKEYNSTNYDVLYPKTVSQQVLLNDLDVAELIGLTISDPTVTEAISKVQTNLNGAYNVLSTAIVGSYVGTGESGSSHKNSLTFPFVPKVVIVQASADTGVTANYPSIFIHNAEYSSYITYSYALYLEWDDINKTVNWYSPYNPGQNADFQQNKSGVTYFYVAFS
jgi:hypothetical protein